MPAIVISNKSSEPLIFCFYGCIDTIQATSIRKCNIPASETFTVNPPTEGTFMMHVYRPTFFGMLNFPMTNGYGFPVNTGDCYVVHVIEKDSHDNYVSVHREGDNMPIPSKRYHFGDMLLNPRPPVPPPPSTPSQLQIEINQTKEVQ